MWAGTQCIKRFAYIIHPKQMHIDNLWHQLLHLNHIYIVIVSQEYTLHDLHVCLNVNMQNNEWKNTPPLHYPSLVSVSYSLLNTPSFCPFLPSSIHPSIHSSICPFIQERNQDTLPFKCIFSSFLHTPESFLVRRKLSLFLLSLKLIFGFPDKTLTLKG